MRRNIFMDNSKATAEQALDSFFFVKRGENKSEATLSLYKTHLRYFYDVLDIKPTDSLFELNWADLTLFSNTILEEKKDVTSASYCRSVRAFIYWLAENGYLKNKDIAFKIPKYQKTVKKTYSDEDLQKLLKNPLPCSATEYQSYVFINLVISTGLRLSSLLNLRVSDYNPKEGYIVVDVTKNKIGQTRYINKQMCQILNDYVLKLELDCDDFLFCNTKGNRPDRRTFAGQIERYNKKRDVSIKSVHAFRHTFAKNYIKNGGSMRDLQLLLGHSSIAITENYCKDLGLDSKTTLNVYNPQTQYKAKAKSHRRIIK